MKKLPLFFIALLSLASCKRLYQCSCNETTTLTYIEGAPQSHHAYSYIKKASKKEFKQHCKGHEFTYQDTTKIVTNVCTMTEE